MEVFRRSAGLACLLQVCVVVAAHAYQPWPVVPDSSGVESALESTASFKTVRGQSGWLETSMRNQNYYAVECPTDSGEQRLVLLETSDCGVSLPPGEFSCRYELRAWPLNDAGSDPIWTIKDWGNGAEVVQSDYRSLFYKTWSTGCCGDWGHTTYYDLATGKVLVTAEAATLALVLPGTDQWRILALDCTGSSAGEECVLRYVRSDLTVDTLTIRGVSGDLSIGDVRLRLLDEDGKPLDRELVVVPGDVDLIGDSLRIQACLVTDTLIVAIRGDRFEASTANLGRTSRRTTRRRSLRGRIAPRLLAISLKNGIATRPGGEKTASRSPLGAKKRHRPSRRGRFWSQKRHQMWGWSGDCRFSRIA